MKIRTDFVTNSSSSSFVTVQIETFDDRLFPLFEGEEDFAWQEHNMPVIKETGPHIHTWNREEGKYVLHKLSSVEELVACLYFNIAEEIIIEEFLPIFSYLRGAITEDELIEVLCGSEEYEELQELNPSAYESRDAYKADFKELLQSNLEERCVLAADVSITAFKNLVEQVENLHQIRRIVVSLGESNWDEFMEQYQESFYGVMNRYEDVFAVLPKTDPSYPAEKKKWVEILRGEALGPNIELLDESYEELVERALASGRIEDMMPRSVLETRDIICDFSAVPSDGVDDADTLDNNVYWGRLLGYSEVDGGISGGAFSCCDNLREVVVPEGITEIGSLAFAECSKLERVYIPATVTQIDETAFGGCGNVTICAPKNSVAHIFAEENGILFEQHGQVSKTDVDLLADQTMIDLSLSTKETLEGKTFVVTGDLYNYPSREDLKKIIEQYGGKLTGSVSSKTTALITNFPDSGTAKIKKAQELGIEIITEEEFVLRYLSEQSKNIKMLLQTEDNTEITTTGSKAWESLFAPWILERGRNYANAGIVFDIQQRPGKVYAKIEGQDSYDVSIVYNEAKEIQDIQCTCPYAEDGNYCKHSAALLYALDLDLKPLAETEDRDEFDEEFDFDSKEAKIDDSDDDFDGDCEEYVSFNLILGVVPNFDTTFNGVVQTIKSFLSNIPGAKSWSKGIQADRKNGEVTIEEDLVSHDTYEAIFPKMCEEIAKKYPNLPFQGVAEYSELRGDSGEVCLIRYFESKLSVLNIASGCRLAICPECDADVMSLVELAETLINNPDATLVCEDCGAEFTPQELFEDDWGLSPNWVINTYDMTEIPSSTAGSAVCTQTDILAGKTFVVTGDLYHYASRDVLKEIIEAQGGKLTGSVSSKTTALVTNFPDSGTTKIRKAVECGVEIISEDDFIARYLSTPQNQDSVGVVGSVDKKDSEHVEETVISIEEEQQLSAKALQEEADQKHQEEAAAQARALEMVRKAAEEEKQHREAEERKRLEEEELKRKEAEEQKRREEEERKQKEAEARRLAEGKAKAEAETRRIAEEKYQADLKSWEENCADIRNQRDQAVSKRLAAEKAALEQAAQKDYDTAVSTATTRKITAQQNKSDTELRLSKLGLFKFAEKNAMKEAIAQAEAEIAVAEKELEQAKQDLNTTLATIAEKVSAQEATIRQSVEREIAFPVKPANPNM